MANATKTAPRTTVKPIPEGYQTITASLTCSDAREQMDFLKRALGAEERTTDHAAKRTRPEATPP